MRDDWSRIDLKVIGGQVIVFGGDKRCEVAPGLLRYRAQLRARFAIDCTGLASTTEGSAQKVGQQRRQPPRDQQECNVRNSVWVEPPNGCADD